MRFKRTRSTAHRPDDASGLARSLSRDERGLCLPEARNLTNHPPPLPTPSLPPPSSRELAGFRLSRQARTIFSKAPRLHRMKRISRLIYDADDDRQSKLSQEQLVELQKSTHFDKKELQQWYKGALNFQPSSCPPPNHPWLARNQPASRDPTYHAPHHFHRSTTATCTQNARETALLHQPTGARTKIG